MIEEILYQHLVESLTFNQNFATWNNTVAVFNQEVPPDTDPLWGDGSQYGRLVFMVDLSIDPARKVSSNLVVDVMCEKGKQEPEVLEPIVRNLIDGYFFTQDGDTMMAQWKASNYFTEPTERVIGVTISFNLLAFPQSETIPPDPINLINEWTAEVLAERMDTDIKVIGYEPEDDDDDTESASTEETEETEGTDENEETEGTDGNEEPEESEETEETEESEEESGDEPSMSAWKPTPQNPAIYWRISQIGKSAWLQDTYNVCWQDATIQGHIFAADVHMELKICRTIENLLQRQEQILFTDGSPLFVDRNIRINTSNDPLRTGQISVVGTYGLLREYPDTPTVDHIHLGEADAP